MAEVTHTAPVGNARNIVMGSLTATDDTVTLTSFLTHGSFAIQLSGTFTGTVTFETSIIGGSGTWVARGVFPIATPTGTVATTATAVGVWADITRGDGQIRARFSTASSGTCVATIRALQGQY